MGNLGLLLSPEFNGFVNTDSQETLEESITFRKGDITKHNSNLYAGAYERINDTSVLNYYRPTNTLFSNSNDLLFFFNIQRKDLQQ